MPRGSRSRNAPLRAPLAFLCVLGAIGCLLPACNGQLAFDSPVGSGSAGSAGSIGGAGVASVAGMAGSPTVAGAPGAGAGNTGGSGSVNHGPEACLSDSDCGLPSLHCQTSLHQCVECLMDAQCPKELPACSDNRCVECDGQIDCGSGQFCDLQSNKCLTHCSRDSDCDDSLNQYCRNGTCLTCDGDEDCIPKLGGTVCQRSAGACVQCLDKDACGGVTPLCLTPVGKCVACVSSRDCASTAPYCDPSVHQCSAAAR